MGEGGGAGSDNTHLIREDGSFSEKSTVCCSVNSNGVLDPNYFDCETVRGEDYGHLLNTSVPNSKHLFPPNHFFQQDRVSPDTTTSFVPFFMSYFRVLG